MDSKTSLNNEYRKQVVRVRIIKTLFYSEDYHSQCYIKIKERSGVICDDSASPYLDSKQTNKQNKNLIPVYTRGRLAYITNSLFARFNK